MALMRFEVSIDELVLVGFGSCDRHAIADAVEREVAALVRGGALRELTSSVASETQAVDWVAPAGQAAGFPERLGAGVAGSLVNVLSRQGR